MTRFLTDNGLTKKDLRYYLTHPGGPKVIDVVREGLDLQVEDMRLSEELLNQHCNISSVSVLIILEQWLRSQAATAPGYCLLSAFGAGFSAELLLLKV